MDGVESRRDGPIESILPPLCLLELIVSFEYLFRYFLVKKLSKTYSTLLNNEGPLKVLYPLRAMGGGGVVGGQVDPLEYLALNFCSLTDYRKLWYNCSLLVKIYFDAN